MTNLQCCQFINVLLNDADFTVANLKETTFYDVQTRGTLFFRANFTKANMSGANFEEANFDGSNFDGTNFSGSNLSGTNFYMANLKDADFTGAEINGANLERTAIDEAYGFEKAQLETAINVPLEFALKFGIQQ